MTEERKLLAWGAALSFCSLGSQYALRPVRDAMGVAGQTGDLPRLFLFTLAGTLAMSSLVALVARFTTRRRLLAWFYRAIAVALVVFAATATREPSVAAARGFFVAASVTNLFVGSLAWSVLVDVFPKEQGARVFGLVSAGGTLGALFGSLVASLLTPHLGFRALLLIAALLLELATHTRVGAKGSEQKGRSELRPLHSDPYWALLVAYMVLYTSTSTFAYLEQARIVKAAVATTDARAALFARMDLAVNGVSFVLQATLTRAALTSLGTTGTLVVLPLLTSAGFFALRASPTLSTIVAFQVARRVLEYTLAKPAREVLFTVVPPERKYAAKNFVDTFVYRGGDALSAQVYGALAPALGAGVILLSVPVCLAWAAVSATLGRAIRHRD